MQRKEPKKVSKMPTQCIRVRIPTSTLRKEFDTPVQVLYTFLKECVRKFGTLDSWLNFDFRVSGTHLSRLLDSNLTEAFIQVCDVTFHILFKLLNFDYLFWLMLLYFNSWKNKSLMPYLVVHFAYELLYHKKWLESSLLVTTRPDVCCCTSLAPSMSSSNDDVEECYDETKEDDVGVNRTEFSCDSQQVYENSGNQKKVLFLLCLGLCLSETDGSPLFLFENESWSRLPKTEMRHVNVDFAKEIVRRARLLPIYPTPQALNWPKAQKIEWLETLFEVQSWHIFVVTEVQ